jgi:hypothetical protein
MWAGSGFIDLVRAMRAAQKDFFKTKSLVALQLSKRLERQVDQYLDHLNTNDLFASNGIFGGDGDE